MQQQDINNLTNERVDIHTHILPRIDDGARNNEEALDMLRMAQADGTTTIVATPHSVQVTPERLRNAAEALRLEARTAGIEIEILDGCEVKFSANLAEDYRAGNLMTINDGAYMLIEFSFSRAWTSLVHTSLYALQMAGVTPIVAHAERYPAIQESPSNLLELAGMGIPVQINVGSLLGQNGANEQATAELLIRAGLAHILASDGHRADIRQPVLQAGFDRVRELAGEDLVQRMERNARNVIASRSLNLPEPDADTLKPASRLHRIVRMLKR